MCPEELHIDLTYRRSPLALRQGIAHAFGIPINREFTWDILRDLICAFPMSALPKRITVRGWPSWRGSMRDETTGLNGLFHELKRCHPDIKLGFILH
jgi:hypothetical protein